MFDALTLNTVYRDVINALTSHFEIEVSVLQALSYCLYEIMDNVHIHSLGRFISPHFIEKRSEQAGADMTDFLKCLIMAMRHLRNNLALSNMQSG